MGGLDCAASVFRRPALPATDSPSCRYSNPVAPTYNDPEVFAFPATFSYPCSVQWNVGGEALGRGRIRHLGLCGRGRAALSRRRRGNLARLKTLLLEMCPIFLAGSPQSSQAMQIKYQRLAGRAWKALSPHTPGRPV